MNSPEAPHLGEILRHSRIGQALSREQVAAELQLHPDQVAALEEGRWKALPQGGVRPLARQVAERLGVDLAQHVEAFEALPGLPESPPLDPARERQERWAVAGLSLFTLAMLGWLLVPGPRLRQAKARPTWLTEAPGPYVPPPPPPEDVLYPVLGELLPEAPLTAEGTLVVLRAQDQAQAKIEGGGDLRLEHALRVSDPWKLRVKGPFLLKLENAGVVRVEVAGRPVDHGATVGEAWEGRFDGKGELWRPPASKLEPEPEEEEP